MKKKKGFTLVELLAVIVILAIILAIAIPSVTGIVNNAKRNAFEQSTKMLLRAIDYKLMQDNTYDVTQIKKTATENTIESELKIDSSNFERVTVTVVSNKPNVSIVGDNKWDGLTASGSKNSVVVADTVVDTTAPVITLSGDNPLSTPQFAGANDCYDDLLEDVIATDDIDGDITNSIIMSPLIDCTISGEYTITFNVSDNASNPATPVNRTIHLGAGGPTLP